MRLSFDEFAALTGLHRSLLVAIPHPDDETLGCGGVLSLAAQRGIRVKPILITDGGASHPGSQDWPRTRVAARRRDEFLQALDVLGITTDPTFLDLPDAATGALGAGAIARAIEVLLEAFRTESPDVVLTTWRREPHCDHRFAFELVRNAISLADSRPTLAEYMVWTPITGSPADQPAPEETSSVFVDVSTTLATKRHALRCHASQLGELISDDPQGFCLTKNHIASMVGPYERFEIAR